MKIYTYIIEYKTSTSAMPAILTISAVNDEQAGNTAMKEIENAYGNEIAKQTAITIKRKKRI